MEQEAIKTSVAERSNSDTSCEHISHDNPIISTNAPCSTPLSLQNHYEFIEEIGRGSQGKIYKARRLNDNKVVVIKQLNINSIKNWKEYELFHREADILHSLNFKGVAKFYDAIDCLDDNPPCSYIVQEYIPGISLQKMLDNGHRFKIDDVYNILIQTLSVLNKLHHHVPPVIHRDIKPSNLMISTDNKGEYQVTIIDFGAVANPQVQGGGSTVAGTYGYMPPEQLMGKPVPASDIYSVAALAVQLFSGKSPAELPVKDFRLIFEPEMQNKPHALVATLRQMLEPKLELRLQNIPEIIQNLTNYKNNQFEQNHLQNTQQYAEYFKDFENKLEKVRYLCQPGNMDLWQQLPDLSRPIPMSFQMTFQINNHALDVGDTVKFTDETSSLKYHILFYISIIGLILMFTVPMPPYLGGLFVLFAITALATGILYGDSIIRELSLLFNSPKQSGTQAHNTKHSTKVKIFELIQNGRKDIATITKIEYLPVDSKDILRNQLPGTFYNALYEYTSKKSTIYRHCMNAVMCKPRFRIQYRFNPPDDMRVADIYHTFVTATEPENHYKVGDPLPILYQIEDRYTEDVVTSMPFPVPLEDMDDDSIVTSSTTFENLNKSTASKIKDIINWLFLYDWPGGPNSNPNRIISLINELNYHDKSINQITWLYLVKCLQLQDYQEFHTYCITVLFHMAFPSQPEQQVTEIQQFLLDFLKQLDRDDEPSRKLWLRYIYVISQNADKLNHTAEYSKPIQELFSTCFESLSPEYITIIFNSLTNSSVIAGFIKNCSHYHLSVIDDNLHLLIEPLINSISYTDNSYNQQILPYIEKYLNDFTNHPDYSQHLNDLLRIIYPKNLQPRENLHKLIMHYLSLQITRNGLDLSNPIFNQFVEHIDSVLDSDTSFVSNQLTRKELLEKHFCTIFDSLRHSKSEATTFKILKSLNADDINHELIALSIRYFDPNCTTTQRHEFFKDLRRYLLHFYSAEYLENDTNAQHGKAIIKLIFDYYDKLKLNTNQYLFERHLLEPLSNIYRNHSYKGRIPNLNSAPDQLIIQLKQLWSKEQIEWIEKTYLSKD